MSRRIKATSHTAHDLLQEGEQGAEVATIANFTFGSWNYSIKSIQDSNSDSETKITNRCIHISSLVLEDRGQCTPPHQSLALFIPREPNHVSVSSNKNNANHRAIRIELLTRIECGQEKTSAKFEIPDSLMRGTPDFIDALTVSVNDSTRTICSMVAPLLLLPSVTTNPITCLHL